MRYTAYFLLFFCTSLAAASPSIDIKGFGTAGVIRNDSPSYFLSEFGAPARRPTFTPDTRVGLNFGSKLSNSWTVATQFVSELGSAGYTVSLDWGFISFQPIPELAIRVGRLVAASWLYSPQIKIGYSYIWVRPPVEVYSLLSGVTSLNGVSFLSNLPLLGGNLSSELFAGMDNNKVYSNNPASPTVSDVRENDFWGIDLNYNLKEIWTLHASYLQSHPDVKINSLSGNSGAVSTVVTPLDLVFGQFLSVGTKLDYANFLFISEFARRLFSGNAYLAASAWYATLGYKISKVTPYFTYAWQGALSGSYYLHPDYPTVTSMKTSQFSYQFGINAQVDDSIILKAEWQPAYYTFADSSKNFRASILSASANFIF